MEWALVIKIGLCLGQWCIINTTTYPDLETCWRAADKILEQGPPEGKVLYAYCRPAPQ